MPKYRTLSHFALFLIFALLLVACGGSGGTGAVGTSTPDTTLNQPGTGPHGLPLYCPLSVTVDHQDTIYVSDNDNALVHERIIKLSGSGQEISEWHIFPAGNIGMNQGPGSAALDAQGNMYVIDLEHFKVLKVSPNGKILTSWGSFGSGQGQFQEPGGVTVDSHGDVYVGDNGTGRVEEFSSTGKFLSVVTTLLNTYPISLAVDSSDNLYVASNNFLKKFSPSGQIIGQLQITSNTSTSTTVWTTISINTRGDIYATQLTLPRFSSTVYPKIEKIDFTTGKALSVWSVWKSGIESVSSTALDSQGNLYATEKTLSRAIQLQKFSSTGDVLATWKGTCSSS